MDFIIVFFRDMIDGWVYYTVLVVNTILILAIIGYLGDKKNAEIIKMGMNTGTPTFNNGTVDLSSGLNNNNVDSANNQSAPSVIPQLSAMVNPNANPQMTTQNSPINNLNSPQVNNTASIPNVVQSTVTPMNISSPLPKNDVPITGEINPVPNQSNSPSAPVKEQGNVNPGFMIVDENTNK